MTAYADFYKRSIDLPEAFWKEQACLVEWFKQPSQICDYSNPPFAKWYAGGKINLCHNAVDRHLKDRASQAAVVFISTETNTEKTYNFRQLHTEVQCMAVILQEMGVKKGDRVLIYMPMIAEALFAMLACVRIGAIHSVVFGGFASGSLASRIDDATPRVVITADAGSRAGKIVPYTPLLKEAVALAGTKPESILIVDRGLSTIDLGALRAVDYAASRQKHLNTEVPCAHLDATDISYTLYTSGTTGKPKGVQRDTGGYAVALAASMKYIFDGKPGQVYFATSDIGWVVGHSYIVYGPLIAGMTTLFYEGTPVRGMDGGADGGIWWKLVEKYKVTHMFSAPTAIRVLKKQDEAHLKKYDLSSLQALFLAGEPVDEPTARWIAAGIGKPVIDNYWQTETGWPILTLARGVAFMRERLGSPGVAMPGFRTLLVDPETGATLDDPHQKGVLVIDYPLPPGCLQTVWGDDARFVSTYWSSVPNRQVYSTFDVAMRDADGYTFILGRSDDVINVAGHRLGTREIEESVAACADVAEVAVVGVADELKGQVAVAFVVARHALPDDELARRVCAQVEKDIGAVARPARVVVVAALPKTRSGKLLRRAMQAICEGREIGDLSTLEDAATLHALAERVRSL